MPTCPVPSPAASPAASTSTNIFCLRGCWHSTDQVQRKEVCEKERGQCVTRSKKQEVGCGWRTGELACRTAQAR
eukprot:747773-Rhodomonas_salina.2